MNTLSAIESAFVNPVTVKGKLARPITVNYKSTFLPEGDSKTFTEWAELIKYIAVMIDNQAGGEFNQSYLTGWFDYTVLSTARPDDVEASIKFETEAPHGMTYVQEYGIISES